MPCRKALELSVISRESSAKSLERQLTLQQSIVNSLEEGRQKTEAEVRLREIEIEKLEAIRKEAGALTADEERLLKILREQKEELG